MKPYGIPRHLDVGAPDMGDLHTYALKASAGNVKNKSGQIRSTFKKSAKKRRVRRYWKKRARRASKRLCFIKEEIIDENRIVPTNVSD